MPTSDAEPTIADGLIDPTWVGGVRHLVDILIAYGDSDKAELAKILDHLVRLGRGAGIKRLGFLIERFYPSEKGLIAAAPSRLRAGNIRLDPSIERRGRLSKRWGLWVNVSVPQSRPR